MSLFCIYFISVIYLYLSSVASIANVPFSILSDVHPYCPLSRSFLWLTNTLVFKPLHKIDVESILMSVMTENLAEKGDGPRCSEQAPPMGEMEKNLNLLITVG